MSPRFFKTQDAFRAWLANNHERETMLLVGFHKNGSGKPSMSWSESVDQALCYGWIDGVRKRIDDASYTIRFTRRRRGSIWSAINIRKATELTKLGLMAKAGEAAYADRRENRSGIYAYEQRSAELPDPYARTMRKNKRAWSFFEAQPPSYRKTLCWWIVSAKQEPTRAKRLAKLIEASEAGTRL